MKELTRDDERALYDMLIKAFFSYKCFLNNETISDPDLFERLAYSDYHANDYTTIELPVLKKTIESIVGNILNIDSL